MEINGPPSAQLDLTASLSQRHNLRIGQIVQAVVIKQLTSNTVLLQLLTSQTSPQSAAGQALQLKAETPLPLVLGQQLQLEVSQLGEKPILRVLGQMPTTEPALKQLLLQALPRQSGMTPLLANLGWLSQQQAGTSAIPLAILGLAKDFFEKLTSRENVSSAEGLKQAIKDSGVFLEGKMGQAAQKNMATDSGGDIKSLLLRLLSAVQKESAQTTSATPQQAKTPPLPTLTSLLPLPPIPGGSPVPQGQAEATLAALSNTLALLQELVKQVEGSIARTQLHQLASLPTPEQNPHTWSFELPVRNQQQLDLFQFIIEEYQGERDEDGEPKRRWNITIAFELEMLGPMYARLQLENGKISTTFWADSFDTSTLINQNLPELAQRFKKAGLESSELRCYHGQPPRTSNHTIPRNVLDVKA